MIRRPVSPYRRAFALVVALAVSGCVASASIRAARDGNVVALRPLLEDETRRGGISVDEARDLARATAAGVIARAKAPHGVADISELVSCASSLDGALEARANHEDEIGAAAAMLRLEEGLTTPEAMVRYAILGRGDLTPSQAAWRTVGARALVGKGSGTARRILLADPDEHVRIAALRAAIDAGDADDADAVLEAARLDPNPLARTLAIRAAGAIGGERVVLALRDLWATAGEPEREAIVDAWGTRRAIHVGGRRELGFVVDSEKGSPAIAAALVLSRTADAGSALSLLERAIRSGTPRDRVFAASMTPLASPAIRDAIVAASNDSDDSVALAALSRRLKMSDLGADRAAVVTRLLALADGVTTRSLQARGALAHAHAREVLPVLTRDRASSDLRVRETAGLDLAAFGDLPAAAMLLADPDERLRARVACAILRSKN